MPHTAQAYREKKTVNKLHLWSVHGNKQSTNNSKPKHGEFYTKNTKAKRRTMPQAAPRLLEYTQSKPIHGNYTTIPTERGQHCLTRPCKDTQGNQDRLFQDRLLQATNTTSQQTSKQEDRGVIRVCLFSVSISRGAELFSIWWWATRDHRERFIRRFIPEICFVHFVFPAIPKVFEWRTKCYVLLVARRIAFLDIQTLASTSKMRAAS